MNLKLIKINCRIQAFTELIKPFICADDDDNDNDDGDADDVKPGMITQSELDAQKHRTNRHLRCSELLHQLSSKSELIVLYDFLSQFFNLSL